MPRPKRHRRMGKPPVIEGFRPFGGKEKTGMIEMFYEEYEALKLADYDRYPQAKAASEMGISRPTFTRIYDSALKKIAKAFVENKQIVLEGGSVAFDEEWFKCRQCNNTFKLPGHGKEVTQCPVCGSQDIDHVNERIERDRTKKDLCECLDCSYQVAHSQGTPCREMTCPQCGGSMRRTVKRNL